MDVPFSLIFKRLCFAIIDVLFYNKQTIIWNGFSEPPIALVYCTYCGRFRFTFIHGVGTNIQAYMCDYYATYNCSPRCFTQLFMIV